jgi:hypothetical protein
VAGCASGRYAHSALVSGDVRSAELVVLRASEFSLGTLALVVLLDSEKLAKLRPGHFVEFRIQPGTYQLTMGNLGIPNRVNRVGFDSLQLNAGTRTYVILGNQGGSNWYSTKPTRYCLSRGCRQNGRRVRRKSTSLFFGFNRLTEEEAQVLMVKYERIVRESLN